MCTLITRSNLRTIGKLYIPPHRYTKYILAVSFSFKSSIYPVVFRYQEQKPANFAGFLLF